MKPGGAEGQLLSLPGRLTAPIQRVWHDYQFKKQSLIHAGGWVRVRVVVWLCVCLGAGCVCVYVFRVVQSVDR